MSMVVIGTVFVDIKGYPYDKYVPTGRNSGDVQFFHGGVARNIVEDIANVELRPIFVSTVDQTGTGLDVINKLKNHKVDTSYMRQVKDGMGSWLVIFNNDGDVAGSISKRFSTRVIYEILRDNGDEIFQKADCALLEVDMEKEVVKLTYELAKKYNVPVYAVISNMSIAVERREHLIAADCLVCNELEAGIFFSENYEDKTPEEMTNILKEKVENAGLKAMVVTLGAKGAVYANNKGEYGYCPALKVDVKDTTGAGDSFFAGVSIGLNYGKTLGEACQIGARLAASVISTNDNVCPRFLPKEFGIDVEVID